MPQPFHWVFLFWILKACKTCFTPSRARKSTDTRTLARWRGEGRGCIFYLMTGHEFCRLDKSHKFCLIWFFCNLLLRQNSVGKFCYKDFYKISPVHTKRFVAAMCRRNMLLQLVAQYAPTIRPLSAFSRVFSVNPPQKYQESSEKDYKLSALSSLAFSNWSFLKIVPHLQLSQFIST